MLWIIAGVAVVAATAVFLVATAGKPTYYRWKRISFLKDYAQWFASDLAEGSVLRIGD